MSVTVRSPKDFWVGLIYLGTGSAALWFGRNYAGGSGAEMGPGYFPTALGLLLGVFGVVSLAIALTKDGEPVGHIAWKPLALLTLSVVLFGLLLKPIGLAGALVVLVLVSASASREFRFDPKAFAGLVVLVVFCCAVFREFLGLPVPVLGTWLR